MREPERDVPRMTPLAHAVVRVLRGEMAEQGLAHTDFNGVLGQPVYVRSRLGRGPDRPLSIVELETVCERLGIEPGDVVTRAGLRIAGGTPLPPTWPEERPPRQPHWGGDKAPARDTP